MSRKKPNILLVGVGRWGMNHLRVLKQLEVEGLCKLYGVCDVDEEVLNKVKKKYEIKCTTDYEAEIKNDEVLAVDIVTPIDTHYEICKKALEAGKDVFVEKPITDVASQAKELAELADEQKLVLMVGHIFHYNPATQRVKGLIQEGVVGDILFMYGHFMGVKPRRNDCGVTLGDAVHHIEVFNYLMDRLPNRAWGIVKSYLGGPLDDTSVVFLDYGGSIAYVETSCLSPAKLRDLVIVGTQKSITSDLLAQTVRLHEARDKYVDRRLVKELITSDVPIEYKEPLKIELVEFVNCIRKRRKPPTDGWVGYYAVRIAETALESARAGKPLVIRY